MNNPANQDTFQAQPTYSIKPETMLQQSLEQFKLSPAQQLLSLLGKSEVHVRVGYPAPNIKSKRGLEDVDAGISQANQQGKSFYFVVNNGGQESTEISQITALFIDVDVPKDKEGKVIQSALVDGKLPLPAFHLEPSAIIRSGSGGFHAYWILEQPLDVDAVDFRATQKRLIRFYNSDPQIHDLCRIMRIPGSKNFKHEPATDCYIEYLSGKKYILEQILKDLPLNVPASKQTTKVVPIRSNKRGGEECAVSYRRVGDKLFQLRTENVPSSEEFVLLFVQDLCSELASTKEGGRNQKLVNTARICFSLTTSTKSPALYSEVWEMLKDAGLSCGLEEDEISRTLESALTSDIAVKGQRLVEVIPTYKPIKATPKEIVKVLEDLGYSDIWFNLMNSEYYCGSQMIEGNWYSKVEVEIYQHINLHPIVRNQAREVIHGFLKDLPKEELMNAVQLMGRQKEVHPVREYLGGLNYSKQEQIDDWIKLQHFYQLSDLTVEGLKLGIKQAVSGFYNAKSPLEIMIVLYGKQGTGKTKFLEQLFTLGLTAPYISSLPDPKNKDSIIPVFSSSAVICDEVSSHLKSKNIESTKALLSQRSYRIRPSYGRTDMNFNREATYWGTSNVKEMLTDTTGNRRILILDWAEKELKSELGYTDSEIRTALNNIIPKLWAWGVDEYAGNPEVTISKELREVMESKENFMVNDREDEILEALFISTMATNFLNNRGDYLLPLSSVRGKLEGIKDFQIKNVAEKYGFKFESQAKIQGSKVRSVFRIGFDTFHQLAKEE